MWSTNTCQGFSHKDYGTLKVSRRDLWCVTGFLKSNTVFTGLAEKTNEAIISRQRGDPKEHP